MIWFTSDTHFGHKNIVLGESSWADKSGCRNFTTVSEHDDYILDLLNTMVGRRDTLYHLGDFSFGGESNIKKYRDRINCETVHIIYGNHDHHIKEKGSQYYGFASGHHYFELATSAVDVVLCHYPIESWNNMERGSIHLHGHVHGKGSIMAGRLDLGITDANGLISLDDVAELPKAHTMRHTTINGGNKFGSQI